MILRDNFRRAARSLLLLIFVVTLLSTGCDRKIRGFAELRKGVWMISKDAGVAIMFEEEGSIIKGKYFLTESPVAEINSFTARWKRSKLVFDFAGNKKLELSGSLTPTDDGYTITVARNRTLHFTTAPVFNMPRQPGRYETVITGKVGRIERQYGHAPGYYSSMHVADMTASSYPEIILKVVSEVTANMFSDSVAVMMDIYRPLDDTITGRPLLLLIHGGAFVIGDKRDELQRRLATYYAQCGYVVASINYRLGYPFVPGMYSQLERCIYRGIQDVRASLRYLSERSDQFNIDPDKVFVVGNSAGGFLSLFTAFLEDHEAWRSTRSSLFGLRKELGCLDCSTNKAKGEYRIAGVVNLWGGITDLSIIAAHEKIPVHLVHGTADRIVPFDYDYPFTNLDRRLTAFFSRKMHGSKAIYDHMRSLGLEVSLNPIQNGNHEPQNDDTITFSTIRSEISEFMLRILTGTPLQITGPELVLRSTGPTKYTAIHHNNRPLQWECKGGLIVRNDSTSVDVVWFEGVAKRQISAAVIAQNGLVRRAERNISIFR